MGPVFAGSFDSEKVRRDRVVHWLMRSTIVQFGDIQGLADRAVRPIGDTAQRREILGGEAANRVITDAVGLAEHPLLRINFV